jgi:glutathione S-transferase
MGNLILWGAGTSRTIRPHWAMHELGIAYERRPILPRTGETQTPEYTALNPRQKIPLLQDDDFTIGESAAIIAYLSRTYSRPGQSLVPQDDRAMAKWLEWCFFIATELDSTSLYIMRRHTDLKHIYGDAPVAVKSSAEYFLKQLRFVDAALADGRQYLLGDRFTSADILLMSCLTWAINYGVGVCDNARPYMDRVAARPAYQQALIANQPPVKA